MSDLSATRKIIGIETDNSNYFVGNGTPADRYYFKITTTEKAGDMAWIIWYQLWYNGQVFKEINSLKVISVTYEEIENEPIPF